MLFRSDRDDRPARFEREDRPRLALLVLNCVYPLVPEQITAFCSGRRAVLVLEEGQPDYIEQDIATTLRRAAHCAVFALFLLLGSSPSFADPVSDLDARATAEYNRGLDARDAGRNGAACQHFRNAEALYHNSIMALSGMGYGHRSEEQLDAIKSFANGQPESARRRRRPVYCIGDRSRHGRAFTVLA